MNPVDLDEAALSERVTDAVRSALGVRPERIEWIPAQLSLRRFARVTLATGTVRRLMARVEQPEDPKGRPPGIPPEPPLEPIRALLERHGLPVPARHGGDPELGIDLLEDLGTRSLADVVAGASAEQRRAWYREACSLVPAMQRIEDPGGVAAFRRRLDPAHFDYKAELFVAHGLPARGRAASEAERNAVRDAFGEIGRRALRAPARLAHRDFQSRNLHLVEREGGARLVMIDLQGALCTAPEYDLVSLLCDSYVELTADEIADHLETTRGALPDAPDPETAAQRFDLLTLARKGKDHARFLYAARERGDARFLEHVPPTVRHLRRAAAAAAAREARFAPLAELVHELPQTAVPACAP